MKIAYFGSDLFMPCLEVFRQHHHEIIAIFIAATELNNQKIIDYANNHNIPYFTEKPDQSHIQNLETQGVECFFSIEYDQLIPLPSCQVKTMNLHPTMLPQGRGPTPLSHLILQYPQYAGVTIHKLAAQFDEGDIILQSKMQLAEDEGLESLLVKLHYKIPQLLHKVLDDLPSLYQQAKPQSGGSYWPRLTDQQRMLNWHDSNANIQRIIRALGRFGVICCIGHEAWLVNHVETMTTQHSSTPGSLLTDDHQVCVIAVTEGIVIIYKDSIIERRDIHIES